MADAAVRTRLARPDDQPLLEDCARQAYAQYVPLIGQEPAPMYADFAGHISRGEAFVAEDQTAQVLGFVICFPTQHSFQLENLAVFPHAAGRGIGTALIKFCEDKTRQAGLDRLTLYTNAKMSRNLTLYPRLGFSQIDRRHEAGFDRVFFEKPIR